MAFIKDSFLFLKAACTFLYTQRKTGYRKSRQSNSIKKQSNLFLKHLFKSYSKENFKYFALYYSTLSTRFLFSKTSDHSVLLYFLVSKVERKNTLVKTVKSWGFNCLGYKNKNKAVTTLRKKLCILKGFKSITLTTCNQNQSGNTPTIRGESVCQKHLKIVYMIDLHDGIFCQRPFSTSFIFANSEGWVTSTLQIYNYTGSVYWILSISRA